MSYPPLPEALVVPVYDNHTHLEMGLGDDAPDYLEQLDSASSVGVRGVVQVGTDLESSRWSAEVAAREPRILAAVNIPSLGVAALCGAAIAEMSDDELATAADRTTVFAKLNPAQKERVVRALHARNHVVGFLGDGINDGPALMEADVGIAIGAGAWSEW